MLFLFCLITIKNKSLKVTWEYKMEDLPRLLISQFEHISYHEGAYSYSAFKGVLGTCIESEDYSTEDIAFDIRTALTPLISDDDQDGSIDEVDRMLAMSTTIAKVLLVKQSALGPALEKIFAVDHCSIGRVAFAHAKNTSPQLITRRLGASIARLSNNKTNKIITDLIGAGLCADDSIDLIKKAGWTEPMATFLHSLTHREELLELMNHAAKRSVIENGLGM
jgi:hypothetical protein